MSAKVQQVHEPKESKNMPHACVTLSYAHIPGCMHDMPGVALRSASHRGLAVMVARGSSSRTPAQRSAPTRPAEA